MVVFFFKQKTAYEMRISDWSSDVCSSDLAISDREAQVTQKFSENVLDARDAWSLFIDDDARLAGLPADVLQATRQAAQDDGKPGWKLTLKIDRKSVV